MKLQGWRLAAFIVSMILIGGVVLTVVITVVGNSAQKAQAADHADREFLHLTVFSDALTAYLPEDLLTDGHQVCGMLHRQQGDELAVVREFEGRGFSLDAGAALVGDGKTAYCPLMQTVPWQTELFPH